MCDRRGELQASTRTLAEYAGLSEAQVRRALKRLVAVRLVEVVASGHGRVATTYKLRWRTRTFPQRFASPSSKDFTSERKRSKSILSDASPSVKTQPLRLGRPVTEQGRRWALGHIRRELMGWGVPGKARGELMAGLANALTRAIKARRIRTGRELGKAVRLILAQLDEGELRASRLAGRDPRSLYSGAAMLVTQAVAEVEADRRTEEATEAILDRIRREREEARRAWADVDATQGKKLNFGDASLELRRPFQGGFTTLPLLPLEPPNTLVCIDRIPAELSQVQIEPTWVSFSPHLVPSLHAVFPSELRRLGQEDCQAEMLFGERPRPPIAGQELPLGSHAPGSLEGLDNFRNCSVAINV